MTKKFIFNPFNIIYQDNLLVSDRPEIQELNEYALDLEEKIALKDTASHNGDFNLDYIVFEFNYNRLAYVRKA